MTFRHSVITALLSILAACSQQPVYAQSPPPAPVPLQDVTIPVYVFMGASYNQFATPAVAGVFSALEPESQDPTSIFHNLLASESVDLFPVQYTDPVSKKSGYVFTGSLRFGEHRILINTQQPTILGVFKPSFVLAVGGDAGPSFSSSGTTPSHVSVGLSGSFTLSGFYRFSQHWAFGVAVRALYMSGIGPGGAGAWNPVIEPGFVYVR